MLANLEQDKVIRVMGLRTQFGSQVIHDGLEFCVRRGEVLGVVGGSGTGKSVLMRTILGLIAPRQGEIEVLGHDTRTISNTLKRHCGVLFQDGALFSALTVVENIQVPMREHFDLARNFLLNCPAVCVNARVWRAPCRWTPKFYFWTNLQRDWIRLGRRRLTI